MAYKCQKITFTIFTILFAIIVIFVAAIFQIILQGKVNGEALMAEENNDLWASFPGRSLIKVYRDNFFYNITDPDNFFQNIKKNQIPDVQELGPYRYQEFTDWINREYSEDLNEVSFHLYKRFKQISEYEIQKQQDKVTTLNLPALGVWQTAKSIPRPNVCLTALYTLWKGLLTDFYFQAAWTGLNTTLNKEDSSLFKSVFIDRLDLPTVTIEKMFSDKKYGLQAENGFFAKALLEYNYIDVDNKDFLFFQKYFDLSFFEMNYFLEKANEIIDKLMGVLIGETDRNKFPRTAAIKQFSSLQVNFGQSIFGKNSTIPGYVEYGAFLKYKAGDYKTKLTYEDFERILAFNDFGYKGVKVDMKNSLLLKKNLDVIMDPLKNKKQSVEDLKKITLINDDEEANHLFDYLNYISGEMALQISKGGKSEQVAFATFVSQAMFQVTDGMGMLLFDNILAKRTYDNEIFNKDCIQILTANLYPGTDVSIYCSDEVNSPMNFETFRDFWYVGIMYKKEELMKFLNYDKIKFNYITNVNANFHLLFKKYVNIISKEYNFDAGHFETKNLLPLVVKQMLTGEITKKEFYGLKSVKDLPQAKGVFVKEPEYYIYCKEQGVKPNLTEEQLLNNLSYDGLFSQFFIQNYF